MKILSAGLLAIMLFVSPVPFTLLVGPSSAQANTQIGAGLTQCALYNQIRQQMPDVLPSFDAWVLGYLSGVNFIYHTTNKVDLLSKSNSDKISGFIQGYCKANPAKTVTNAANEYWFGLAESVR